MRVPAAEEGIAAVARPVHARDCSVDRFAVWDEETPTVNRARTGTASANNHDIVTVVEAEERTACFAENAAARFALDLQARLLCKPDAHTEACFLHLSWM